MLKNLHKVTTNTMGVSLIICYWTFCSGVWRGFKSNENSFFENAQVDQENQCWKRQRVRHIIIIIIF